MEQNNALLSTLKSMIDVAHQGAATLDDSATLDDHGAATLDDHDEAYEDDGTDDALMALEHEAPQEFDASVGAPHTKKWDWSRFEGLTQYRNGKALDPSVPPLYYYRSIDRRARPNKSFSVMQSQSKSIEELEVYLAYERTN